jgi:hypothetical protein
MSITRRRLLRNLGLAAGAGALSLTPRLRRADAAGDGPCYLIVIGCFGGASMLDSFMPIDAGDAYHHPDRGTVISYQTSVTDGSNIRCVDRDPLRTFLGRHGRNTIAMATQSSSVNHFVAQTRSINGRDVFAGRTMAEAVAAVHGGAMTLPNVNMGRGGYSEPGADRGLNPRFRAEIVTNPVIWPFATNGHAGIAPLGDRPFQDPDTREAMVARARALRDGTLESLSPFGRTFAASARRREVLWNRGHIEPAIEGAELMRRLLYVPDLGPLLPLSQYGLTASDEAQRVGDALPGSFPASTSGTAEDRLQAQAALAYLLIRTGTSCAVTLTEPGTDGFLAFDQSHRSHREAQRVHWNRVLDTADRLIGLLESAEYFDGDEPTGTSLWDRSMIVFATEFGRDKWDTGGSFGTGHHLNNGLLVVSPLVQGNQTLGEADPNNGFLTGFDPDTGQSTPYDVEPGEDPLFNHPNLPPGEETVFGTLLAALGVEYEGQETLPVVLRS